MYIFDAYKITVKYQSCTYVYDFMIFKKPQMAYCPFKSDIKEGLFVMTAW